MLKRQKKLILWLVIAILFIAAVGTAAYYVKRYHDSQQQVKKLSSNSQQAAQDQNQQLINKIGKLTPLPTGETPTIATVTDITKLKDQPFFANAVNGDKVLIYTQAKKAYLYRPSTNKLINIAPVNLGATTPATQTPAPTGTATKK
jgi:C4-dicarboxylate-specific signal transduction histidine kinase